MPDFFVGDGRFTRAAHLSFGLFPLVAIPDAQQVMQVGGHLFIVTGAYGLPFERVHARANFGQDVMDALQIVLCLGQAA